MGNLDEFKNMKFDHIKEGFEEDHEIHDELMKTCKDEDSDILKF